MLRSPRRRSARRPRLLTIRTAAAAIPRPGRGPAPSRSACRWRRHLDGSAAGSAGASGRGWRPSSSWRPLPSPRSSARCKVRVGRAVSRRRLAQAAPPTASSSPASHEGSTATQVPTRTARLTPSSARSASTSAALGPPIPVAWMVSSSPAGVRPEYPHSPRAWLLIFGSSSSSWASISARPGSPTSTAAAAIGAVGRRRLGTAADHLATRATASLDLHERGATKDFVSGPIFAGASLNRRCADERISLSEAARRSGVPASTLKRWAEEKVVPVRRGPLDRRRRRPGAGRGADARARPLAGGPEEGGPRGPARLRLRRGAVLPRPRAGHGRGGGAGRPASSRS